MEPHFMEKLQEIRDGLNSPMVVTSGYRCPEYDLSLGGAGNHTTGRAADIQVSAKHLHECLLLAFPLMSGIGIKGHGPMPGRFVHLDDIINDIRPNVWSYK